MRVFASDLDQTLIYSEKWIEDNDETVRCVEQFNDADQSFILEEAVQLLGKINKEYHFIPVTTRTIAQYNRVDFGFTPEYAICSNGGVVLCNGKEDHLWKKEMNSLMKDVEPVKEIAVILGYIDENDIDIRLKNGDQQFFYFVCDNVNKSKKVYSKVDKILELKDWNAHLSGRKVYIMPSFLTKESALSYVLEKMNADVSITAGDSTLDYGMQDVSDRFISPGHVNFDGDYACTSTGLESGLETIKEAYRFLSMIN